MMVDVKSLAKDYARFSMNFISYWLPPSGAFKEGKKKAEEIDNQIGMLQEELTKLSKEELAEFHKEYVRLLKKGIKKLPMSC